MNLTSVGFVGGKDTAHHRRHFRWSEVGPSPNHDDIVTRESLWSSSRSFAGRFSGAQIFTEMALPDRKALPVT
eukprot:54914-Eustigmatos_ZCMA.PRE.1